MRFANHAPGRTGVLKHILLARFVAVWDWTHYVRPAQGTEPKNPSKHATVTKDVANGPANDGNDGTEANMAPNWPAKDQSSAK